MISMNDDGQKAPDSESCNGWKTALKVVSWLIIVLSGVCTGIALPSAFLPGEENIIAALIFWFSVPSMAIGCLLLYLTRKK